jgi:hypothetical protein
MGAVSSLAAAGGVTLALRVTVTRDAVAHPFREETIWPHERERNENPLA